MIPADGATLAGQVARHLLLQHAAALPDLSGLVVLVPNHRAGQDFARALAHAAGLPALIPPRITPLKAWAESLATTVAEPQARRLARLAAVLRREKWLGDVDRWALASELLALADELSAARLGGEIASRIRALRGSLLDRETALIEAVWQALNSDGSDPQAVYAGALARLLDEADAPLYGYALGPLTALEKRFLERYAQAAPVQLFDTATVLGPHAAAQVLHGAWCRTEPPLRERAAELVRLHDASPLAPRLKLCPAPHLEAEARAVTAWVAEQLQAGRRDIALIALDRETARRTRALLERLDVLVADETGWTLSTTTAAAVIDRWLECVAGDFPHVELLDLLKSPFALGDPAARQDAVWAFELALRRQGVARGAADMRRLAQGLGMPCPWLDTLLAAARGFPRARAPLALWLARLVDSLAAIGALAPLGQDAAGADLLALFERLGRELADDGEKYSFNEWRRWLNLALESESFTDKRLSSPIVFTSLPAARGRRFDAVAVVGADAARLPARPAPGLFSQATRAQLGLATAGEAAEQAADDLIQLLVQGPALLSWQAWREDEPNPPSPFVTRLQALHQAAWGGALAIQGSAVPPAAADAALPAPGRRPMPAVAAAALPRRYSPTAYQTLLDCPYRFFARGVLGLKELDEADEALDKSDYGSALHAILKRFHDGNPPTEREAALKLLDACSAAEFAALPAYTACAWRTRWQKIQPAYLDLWLAQTAEGWRYQSGEKDLRATRRVPGLGEVELHGIIDRIDSRINRDGGAALRVIDYKTGSAAALKRKLKDPAEAVQLPFYAWLADAEAVFLPINDDPVSPLTLDGETDVEAIAERLSALLEAMAGGAPLPANGIDAVCSRCEARGLCRKGAWHE